MNPIIGLIGPSGSGKSTLILDAIKQMPDTLAIVKSLTTRERRGEEDDAFYDFVTREEMERRRSIGQLVQVSEYAGNLYAHDRTHVNAILKDHFGICALVEQGVLNLRNAGYEVKLLKIVPTETVAFRDTVRKQADLVRAAMELPINLEIQNAFTPGGRERAVGEICRYVGQVGRNAVTSA